MRPRSASRSGSNPLLLRVQRLRVAPLLGVIALAALSCGSSLPEHTTVRRVIDGDTVALADGRLVRYIGIDAPEVRRREGDRWVVDPEPMSREATEFNRRLVEGKPVRLEYDVQTRDRFGRLLAYVYVSADGGPASGGGETMVNAELVRAGFAQALTIPPNVRYADRFRALAEEARQDERGLWGSR